MFNYTLNDHGKGDIFHVQLTPPLHQLRSRITSKMLDHGRLHTSQNCYIILNIDRFFTYDHRPMDTSRPVRSAEIKHWTGGLVVRWVTTSESPLLYVFLFDLVF